MKKIIMLSSILLLVGCSTMKHSANDNESNASKTKLAMINVQLGMAYLERGNTQRAKQKFLVAIAKDPNLPEVWYSYAYFQEMTGDKEKARQDYLRAVQLAPQRGDIQNNYGTFLCRSGHYQEAIDHFKIAIKDPDYLDAASAYENAGLCALKIPNPKLAKEFFALAVNSDPNRSISANELAKLKTV
jgi:type IV pilus assembly protein PilF